MLNKNYRYCEIYKGCKKGGRPTLAKDWIVFYYFNLNYDKLHLKPKWQRFPLKIGINRLKTIEERTEFAKAMCREMDTHLDNGYNPLLRETVVTATAKYQPQFFTVKQCFDLAITKKSPAWSHKTRLDFNSVFRYFFKVAEELQVLHTDVKLVTRLTIRGILDEMVNRRGRGGHAYHKYKTTLHNIFEYLKDWEIIDYNPCDFKSPVRKPKAKVKQLLTEAQRKKINDNVKKAHPAFYNYLMFIYHTSIRPKELLTIKVKDIHIMRGEILLRAADTKDAEDRPVIIPNALWPFIESMQLSKHDPNDYVFGYDFVPQKRNNPLKRDRATKLWKELVIDWLKIDSKMYWLKHLGMTRRRQAGATSEANKVQAGHSSTSVAEQSYVPSDRPEIRNQLREISPDF